MEGGVEGMRMADWNRCWSEEGVVEETWDSQSVMED